MWCDFLFATRATWSTRCPFLTRSLLCDQGSGKWWFWYCLMRSPFTGFLPLLLSSQIQSFCKRWPPDFTFLKRWYFSNICFCFRDTWFVSLSMCCRCWTQLRLAERSTTRWSISSSLLEGPFRHPCRLSFNKVCKNGSLKAARATCCPAQDRIYVDGWTDNSKYTLLSTIRYWTSY